MYSLFATYHTLTCQTQSAALSLLRISSCKLGTSHFQYSFPLDTHSGIYAGRFYHMGFRLRQHLPTCLRWDNKLNELGYSKCPVVIGGTHHIFTVIGADSLNFILSKFTILHRLSFVAAYFATAICIVAS